VLGTLVLGALPHLHVLWDLTIVSAVLTATYVALLAYFARRAADANERARKVVPLRVVRSLDQSPEQRLAVGGAAPTLRAHPLPPKRPAFIIVEAP
jgi:hypothetical protein